MTRTSLISLVLFAAATAAPAAADPAADDLADTVTAYGRRTASLKHYWSQSIDKRWPIGGCHAAITAAQEAGVAASDEQKTTCDEFRAYHQLAEAERALDPAAHANYILLHVNMGDTREDNGSGLAQIAATCTSELDRLLADGMPTTIVVPLVRGHRLTMADARAVVCEPLAKAAATFAKDVASARTKAHEKAAAPYKAVGVTGQRLALLVDHIDYAMYGTGGGELRTPKQLKSAAVIFELLGPNTATGLYTLRRYQFRGDKLVSTTSRDFLVRPGSKFYR